MTRECPVRFCERLGVKLPRPTHRVTRMKTTKDQVFSAVVVDEGGPLEVGVQKLASNQAVLLRSKKSRW